MTTNIDDPPTYIERKYWYEIILEYGNKVAKLGYMYGRYESFEAYIDQTTSYLTIQLLLWF